MNDFLTLASIELSDADKKAISILIVLLVLLFLVIGLLGMAIRATMNYQAKRADTMMHDAAKAHVVDSPASFRKLAFKKTNRLFFRQAFPGFCIGLTGLIVWIIYSLATKGWTENMFAVTGELFFQFDWVGTPENPVFVKIFFLKVIARFPDVAAYPTFELGHLCHYIETALFVTSFAYYAVVCQAYLSRAWMLFRRSRSVYEKTLEGYRAAEDIDVTPDHPLPPSE